MSVELPLLPAVLDAVAAAVPDALEDCSVVVPVPPPPLPALFDAPLSLPQLELYLVTNQRIEGAHWLEVYIPCHDLLSVGLLARTGANRSTCCRVLEVDQKCACAQAAEATGCTGGGGLLEKGTALSA